MPHIADTPESIVSHSDSKNPATTCRGITSNGLPCRRGLASSTSPQRTATRTRVQPGIDITALYCWQHKDQAESILRRTTWTSEPGQKPPRSSIDTLMDRLGVLEINDTQYARPPQKPKPKKQIKRSFCCFDIIEDDEPLPSKPSRPSAGTSSSGKPTKPQQMQQVSSLAPARSVAKPKANAKPKLKPKPQNQAPSSTSSAQTNSLLAWIPASLSPQTTSLLLTELAKPISSADEPGYIYMFWITPSRSNKSQPPPVDVATSLIPISATNTETINQIRRTSTAIAKARDLNALTSSPDPSKNNPGTVRLKIGRTTNVHRRLNEWTRQCSNHLTLIRYYPYTSSSSRRRQGRDANGATEALGFEPGQKVPHVHRVERLIHLELADIRARDLGVCLECGKEHREWFEVAAERTALKRVDECIRRWVRWAQSQ
ncbi:meiotically up-regulated gene 113-domain-containing protein [Aspergillus pseudodeflectus]|uniref:Meiotically up-regulated gene 113-domain-containing protein n=1 Tax=Aspergillus pseudodeflectus TaxID=176178 RepID=A0ABR4KWQ8_9EURO